MSGSIRHDSGFAGWRGPPFGYSSPPEYPPSASLLEQQDTTHRDGVQREWGRPSTAASQLRIPLLLASLFAVSAMIFLVYLCSLLMKKRITRPSSARRLAASWGREKCEESDSSNTEFRASASSEEQQGLQDASVQLFPGLTPVEELIADTEYTPSLEVTAGASALVFPAETTGQVTTDGEQASLKRRLDESFGEEDWGKMLILDMPHGEGPLQPAPPLDPEFDAFIDTVLFGGEDPFAELGWLPSDEPQNTEPLGLSLGSWPTASSAAGQDERAPLSTAHEGLSTSSRVAGPPRRERKQRIIVRQEPDSCPSSPQNIQRGSAAEVATGSAALDGRAPSSTVHERPSTSPRVPIILRRRGRAHGISEKQTPASGRSSPQSIPRDSAAEAAAGTSGLDGKAASSTVHEGPLASSPVPGTPRREHKQRIIVRQVPDLGTSTPQDTPRGSAAEVAAGTSGLDGRAASSTVHEGSSTPSRVTGTPRKEHKQRIIVRQVPHPDPSTPQNIPRGQAAARFRRIAPAATPVGGAVLLQQHHSIILLSSPTATAAVPQMPLPAGTTPATASVPPSDGDALLYSDWIRHMFSGFSPELLVTHPFYRFPAVQETSPTEETATIRSFDLRMALSLSTTQRCVGTVLRRCGEILKKDTFTPSDLNELLSNVEALCSFALINMPVTYIHGQAKCALEVMGMIFLVLDTLYCAAEVLGERSMKSLWWPLIVLRIREATFVPQTLSSRLARYPSNVDVARALHAALEHYRRSERPPWPIVLGLKMALLCAPGSTAKFSEEQWDGWRQDHAEWIRSTQSNQGSSQQQNPNIAP